MSYIQLKDLLDHQKGKLWRKHVNFARTSFGCQGKHLHDLREVTQSRNNKTEKNHWGVVGYFFLMQRKHWDEEGREVAGKKWRTHGRLMSGAIIRISSG